MVLMGFLHSLSFLGWLVVDYIAYAYGFVFRFEWFDRDLSGNFHTTSRLYLECFVDCVRVVPRTKRNINCDPIFGQFGLGWLCWPILLRSAFYCRDWCRVCSFCFVMNRRTRPANGTADSTRNRTVYASSLRKPRFAYWHWCTQIIGKYGPNATDSSCTDVVKQTATVIQHQYIIL